MADTSLISFSLILLCSAAVNGQLPPKEKFYPIKEDVPFIRCDTCQKAVKYLYRKTAEMRESSPAKKLEEDKVIDLVEKSCDPDKEEGEWISKIDVQQQKDGFLKLSEQSNYGKCRRECKTVSKACEDSVSEVDTDLAELLWRNELSLSKLINEVCYSLSSACRKGQAKMKAGQRKLDEDFMHMSEDERKADKLLKQMRGIDGMPGMNMYSREEMEKMRDQLGEKESKEEEASEEDYGQHQTEAVSFFQIVVDSLSSFWSWLKGLFNIGLTRTEEL